jgi:acetyl-CoA carboxylase biotin carboxyl carrier protein
MDKKMSKTTIDAALIRELAQVLNDTNLTEIEVEQDSLRIRVAREIFTAPAQQHVAYAPAPAPVQPQAAAPVAAVAATVTDYRKHAGAVTSPMVGTAFRRPSPDAKPFVEVGSVVKEGEKVLLIEAMKTFNEINAHKSGTVTHVFVDDGKPVEFGEALLVIE